MERHGGTFPNNLIIIKNISRIKKCVSQKKEEEGVGGVKSCII